MIDRVKLSKLILKRLVQDKKAITEKYNSTKDQIGYFVVDNLLPSELALEISRSFQTKTNLN